MDGSDPPAFGRPDSLGLDLGQHPTQHSRCLVGDRPEMFLPVAHANTDGLEVEPVVAPSCTRG